MDHIRSSDPSARLASVHLLAAAFLPTFLSGCLIVPLPNRDTGNARKDLGQRVANRIEPGVTTMEHVMLELGEPDAVSSNERSIAYRRERAVAIWIAGGGYSAGGGTIDEVRFLVIDFDANGLVTGRQATNYIPGLVSLPGRDSPQGMIGQTSSVGGEEVKINSVADWFPDFEFRALRLPPATIRGSLKLTDSKLCFLATEELGNSEPALSMPYEQIAECRLGKGPVRWMTIRTKQGRVHTFMLSKAGLVSNQMTRRAVSFVTPKLIPAPNP